MDHSFLFLLVLFILSFSCFFLFHLFFKHLDLFLAHLKCIVDIELPNSSLRASLDPFDILADKLTIPIFDTVELDISLSMFSSHDVPIRIIRPCLLENFHSSAFAREACDQIQKTVLARFNILICNWVLMHSRLGKPVCFFDGL